MMCRNGVLRCSHCKDIHDILNCERFGVGCTIPQYELGG
jgi:hypothetical protein